MPSFEGNLLTQRNQITSLKTRNSRLSHGESPVSLSDLGLIRYRVVTPGQTDGRTDRIPIANTRSQQYLPVQLSRVKSNHGYIRLSFILFVYSSLVYLRQDVGIHKRSFLRATAGTAIARLSHRNSVRPSVRLSVRLSHGVDQAKTVQARIT